jgi:membrane protease YdiL (CAAX protease family)
MDNVPSEDGRKPAGPLAGGARPSPWREPGVLILAVVLLGITYYHGNPAWVDARWRLFYWFGVNVLCLLAVPAAIIHFVWRESLEDYGLGPGRVREWVRFLVIYGAVMVPILVAASRLPSLQAFYPRYPWARQSATDLLLSEAGWLVYFLAWEFFYRGFLLFTMARRFPPAVAVAIQAVPFVLMHLPKPEVEAAASVVAGVALGLMAYRGRSMVGTWLLHFGCAALMDVLVVAWPVR